MVEEAATPGPQAARGTRPPTALRRQAIPIRDVVAGVADRRPTSLTELDRVLGGGLVPGSIVLVGGEPGAGKSTLLLQASQGLASTGNVVLYVSAEESPGQVRVRADRLGALHERLLLASATELDDVLGLVEAHQPDVLVLDSVQTVRHPDAAGGPGGIAQVRETASALVHCAKQRDMACLLVGHVTKDGQLAGPRTLEHLVDAVCELDGDRHHALRLLRATKNRFGPAGEVGCFELTSGGLVQVDDAGRLFMTDATAGATGVAVTLALEGRRPLACEVQALVVSSELPHPRRVASGLDPARLNVLAAVLEKRADVHLRGKDVFVSSVGGVRLGEPAVDLALALAIASSADDRPSVAGLVALGEVGLAGDLRLVTHAERRLAEAARLGFRSALLPGTYDGENHGLRLLRVPNLAGALAAGLGG
jgi:DNA repair protein RadA/Sms